MSTTATLVDGYYTLVIGVGDKRKEHRVKSIVDQQLQADFARWNFERACVELAAARSMYTEAEFNVEREKLRGQFRDGLFDFKSKAGAKAITTLPGLEFICTQLFLDVTPGGVLAVLIEGKEAARDLVLRIISDSFPELKLKAEKNLASKRPHKKQRR